MDTDYNFLNKLLIVIQIMRKLENGNKFSDELGGSSKYHYAIEISLVRRLLSDIMRQLRRSGAITGKDAAS